MKLAERVAIVTGGSRGIGYAIARALGSEGARVAIASRSADELASARTRLEREGITALTHATDVTRSQDVDALVDEVLRRWGRVDVLVNNAGATGAIGRFEQCDLEEWKRAIEVNLYGTVHACRAVLPHMRSRRSGAIVNLAGGGVGGPGVAPRMAAYAVSKAAIVQLTEALARDVMVDGIRVNAIAPGAVVTEMTAGILAVGRDRAGAELYDRTVAQRASGGEPPEAAAQLVVWLASEESGMLTGKFLSAKWDSPRTIDVDRASESSLFALRRIDGVLFGEIQSNKVDSR
jgi:NAD(P)-dependent dehydrogenase (short-subunit alcohol dehydrogenase family)